MKKRIMESRVIRNEQVTPEHFLLTVDSPELSIRAEPGQFVNIKVSAGTTDPLLRVPLGILHTEQDSVSFLYKVVGKKTKILKSRQRGHDLNILGPLGNGFDIDRAEQKTLVVSGGHGIAPLFFLAEKLKEQGRDVLFYIGTSTKEHVLCENGLKRLGAEVYVATDDGSRGFKGHVTELLRQHLERGGRKEEPLSFFACGPRPMLAGLASLAEEMEAAAQFSFDAYMACGTGICKGCAVITKKGTKLVCKDGPVFDPRDIDWRAEAREK